MLKSAQKATRGEGGFTLIELLVVMIIIAILMAVAVPTFLKQKQNAQATKAKSNIKQIVTTIESCASANTTGSYVTPRTCLTAATLIADEPVLRNVFGAPGVAVAPEVCTAGNSTQAGSVVGLGFRVTCTFQSDGPIVTYSEDHASGGTILKDCNPAGNKGCPSGLPAGKMW